MLQLMTNSQPNSTIIHPFSNDFNPPGMLKSDCPRIMILYSGILLDELIMELFCDVPNLQICLTPIDKEETIAQTIIAENPQVVILSEADCFSVDKLSKTLETLHCSEAVQIVVVSLHGNSLEVKNNRNHSHHNFKDFVNCIKSNCLND
jgi:hypothetical protein